MSGYSLDTRRRVARSEKWRALAPALTGAQIARLAPTIIVKRPAIVDERQRRYDDPTIFDLADMAWHVREQRPRVETLKTPLPGSNLVVAGECVMPWRQYVRAVVSNQTPGPLRVKTSHLSVAHTLAPHENHTMVPLGWESMSYRSLRQMFLGHRHKRYWHEDCDHEVSLRLDDDIAYRWTCRRCGEDGFEPYTSEDLGRATGVVWHGCLTCLQPDYRPWASRALFESWGLFGIGGKVGYKEWSRPFSRRDFMGLMAGGVAALIAIPFVPPAHGAPNTIFVNYNSGSLNSGDGTTGNPYGSLERARTSGSVVAGNGDTVKARSTGGNYVESFATNKPWPGGTSFSLPTTVTKDTGHTPTLRPNSAVNGIIRNNGASVKYIIYDSLTFDCTSIAGPCMNADSTSNTSTGGSLAANHIRVTGCNFSLLNFDSAYWSNGIGHDNEMLSCVGQQTTGIGAGTGVHMGYNQGKDNLFAGNEAKNWFNGTNTGYGIQAYNGGIGGDANPDRGVYRRNRFHLNPGAGIRHGEGTSQLEYYDLIYNNNDPVRTGGIILRHSQSSKILNCVIVGNTPGGINLFDSDVTNTYLRNNISDGNGGPGNFTGNATALASANHTSGSTNSWNVAGWTSNFVDYANRETNALALMLATGSSAIDRGVSIASDINAGTYPETTVTDFSGTTVSGTPESGAFEFSGGGGGGADLPPAVGVDNANSTWHHHMRKKQR